MPDDGAMGAAAPGSPVRGGGHVVFYACKYTPVELLAGFGAEARLAEADASSFGEAERLAHINLCGYGKGLLERLMAPDVHEAVLITCCDVVKRVYDVLKAQGRLDFLYLLDLPHKRGEAERRLFRARLAGLAASYQDWCGQPFDIGAALASFDAPVPRQDARVAVMGAHASAPLLEAVSGAVEMPVENDTCTGQRLLASPPPALARMAAPGSCDACGPEGAPGGEKAGPHADPGRAGSSLDAFLDWYADALLAQMPCMRMDDVEARESLAGRTGQKGIVYHTMKFCDYYGFEYAHLLKEADGLPMVKVETDGTSQSEGQMETRLEAFAETIGGSLMFNHQQPAGDAAGRGRDGSRPAYVMGIDSGSTSTDVVIMDAERQIVGSAIISTGAKATESARRGMDEALQAAGLDPEDVAMRIATGYGREAVPDADARVTEITCHAKGAHYLMPEARTVIDIGGQDSKAIHLKEDGEVESFVMNDKCAAGTGRFMEMMARTLEMPLEEFCERGREWKHDVRISSMCTVFAESEVVSLVAKDTPTADIIHGLDGAVASKTASLARRVHAEPPYLMTGGVANNEGVVEALSDALKAPIATDPRSQSCGAIGAALLALESLQS